MLNQLRLKSYSWNYYSVHAIKKEEETDYTSLFIVQKIGYNAEDWISIIEIWTHIKLLSQSYFPVYNPKMFKKILFV